MSKKKLAPLIYTIVIIIMVLLQTSFFPQFQILRVKPDLVLLFVVSVALLKGYREGVLTGLLAGLITGIISKNVWGLYVLSYCLAGFAAGMVIEKLEPDNFIIPLVSGAIASAGYVLIFAALGPFFELFYLSPKDFYKALAFLAWNSALSIPVFLVTRYTLVSQEKSWSLK